MWNGNIIETCFDGNLVTAEFVAAEEKELGDYLLSYIKKYPMPQFATTFLVRPYEVDGAWFATIQRYRG